MAAFCVCKEVDYEALDAAKAVLVVVVVATAVSSVTAAALLDTSSDASG